MDRFLGVEFLGEIIMMHIAKLFFNGTTSICTFRSIANYHFEIFATLIVKPLYHFCLYF